MSYSNLYYIIKDNEYSNIILIEFWLIKFLVEPKLLKIELGMLVEIEKWYDMIIYI